LKLDQLHAMLAAQASSAPLVKPSSFELVEQLVLASNEEGGGGGCFGQAVEAFVMGRSASATVHHEEEKQQEQQREQQQEEQQDEQSPLKRPRVEEVPRDTSIPQSPPASKLERRSRFSSHSDEPRASAPAPAPSAGVPAVLSVPVSSLVDFEDMSVLLGATASGGTGGQVREKALSSLLTGFRDRPTLLFSAPHKEPLVSGMRGLDAATIGNDF
jgi:hypothetical protein